MGEPKEVSFPHFLLYLWLVGGFPTLVFCIIFALSVWASFFFQLPALMLLIGICAIPVMLAVAFKGSDKFFKRFPQYSKNAA